jgi:hypothetical protein
MLGTLRAQQESARQAGYGWHADQLLATAEADDIEYVVAECSNPCPVLHRTRSSSLPYRKTWGKRATRSPASPTSAG